jgi:hypothetical protein
LRIGTTLYWIGAIVGLYTLGLAIYIFYLASTDPTASASLQDDAIKVAVGSFLYWFVGRGIRYMLGR